MSTSLTPSSPRLPRQHPASAAPPSKRHRGGDRRHSGPRRPHSVHQDARINESPTWDGISDWVGRLVREERANRETAIAQLNAEIHILKSAQRQLVPVGIAPAPAVSNIPTCPAPDHPLSQFFEERLEMKSWLKTGCGKVASAYRRWHHEKTAAGGTLPPKLNHIAFVAAMKGFAERRGCESRRVWGGIGLKPAPAPPSAPPAQVAGAPQADGVGCDDVGSDDSDSEASAEYRREPTVTP
jgi:hypothetical protein